MNKDRFRPASILLVEDDEIDAMGVQRAFAAMKLANPLHRARDGIEALDILRSSRITPPYIVLLDLNMPRMNGIEFLEAIRDDEELCSAVVFVLTTSKHDEDVAKAYKKNIAGYIVKSSIDHEFNELLSFLDAYWKIVELPVK